jgi:nucleoid DNA-binding protein
MTKTEMTVAITKYTGLAHTLAYDNWKLVAQTTFVVRAAKRGDIKVQDLAHVLKSYKTQVVRTLRKCASVCSLVFGSYKVGKRKTRIHQRADALTAA